MSAQPAQPVQTAEPTESVGAGSPLRPLHPPSTAWRTLGDAEVPWVYQDYEAEYEALRGRCALFDHSGAGVIRLRGDADDVRPFLHRVLARDVEFLTTDKCLTSLVLDDGVRPVDIVTVFLLDTEALVLTSWGCAASTLAHLRAAAPAGLAVEPADDLVPIGVEGPYAWGVVGRVINPGVTALPYESVTEIDLDGSPLLFSRSGVTAEYGYLLLARRDLAPRLWGELSAHAEPAGHAVLETAMLEVRTPVLHREGAAGVIGGGLNWLVDLGKEEFAGRSGLLAQLADPPPTRPIGLRCRQVRELPPGCPVSADGTEIGAVTWSVHSPRLDGALALAGVSAEFAAAGLRLTGTVDGRALELETLAPPYVVPTSWSTPIL